MPKPLRVKSTQREQTKMVTAYLRFKATRYYLKKKPILRYNAEMQNNF